MCQFPFIKFKTVSSIIYMLTKLYWALFLCQHYAFLHLILTMRYYFLLCFPLKQLELSEIRGELQAGEFGIQI